MRIAEDSAPPRVCPLPPSEPPWEVDAPRPAPAAAAGANAVRAAAGVESAGPPRSAAPEIPLAPPPSHSTPSRDTQRDLLAARRVLALILEVVDGRRPPSRIARLLDRAARIHVERLAAEAAVRRGREAATLRTVTVAATSTPAAARCTQRSPGTAVAPARLEVCATYARGLRLYAMAARIEIAADGTLRCSGLRMPV
ncbi:Rv3235 family protein [Dietzia sp.]|uniref:Rv3235 family protein n=1 Tax=Dietzia sp. TaxID=1871616 RepID=UPI002FD9FC72